jgi:thiamine pyrophosphokinase
MPAEECPIKHPKTSPYLAEVFYMKTIIFANGHLPDPEGSLALIADSDLVIAADGGSVHCENLSITPDVVIGDLDSIPDLLLDKWINLGIKTIQHDTDKDQTDLELALHYALEAGSDSVLILGGLGNRWDHSLANLLLAANKDYHQIEISFYADGDHFYIVTDRKEITGTPEQIISILPLGGDALGVSTTGLKWPLENGDLPHGSSRGVSNLFTSEKAVISVQDGVLLVIKNKFQKR